MGISLYGLGLMLLVCYHFSMKVWCLYNSLKPEIMTHMMFKYFQEGNEKVWYLNKNGWIYGALKGGGHTEINIVKKLLGEGMKNFTVLSLAWNEVFISAIKLACFEDS